jgi:hypothetical protein
MQGGQVRALRWENDFNHPHSKIQLQHLYVILCVVKVAEG